MSAWHATAITIFPEMFPGCLDHSLAGRAGAEGVWRLDTVNPRDHARDKHRSVDDTPFGGGAGMVMRADVLGRTVETARPAGDPRPLIYLSARGVPLAQARVRELAAGPGVVLLCGRFEGVDQRVLDHFAAEELCLGDFVLSGGEPAALALLDACIRLLPGVMTAESLDEESFTDGLLEYPHYTRPQEWRGQTVPDVLRSGNHARIRAWRRQMAEAVTRARRPDLWQRRFSAPRAAPQPETSGVR